MDGVTLASILGSTVVFFIIMYFVRFWKYGNAEKGDEEKIAAHTNRIREIQEKEGNTITSNGTIKEEDESTDPELERELNSLMNLIKRVNEREKRINELRKETD